MPEYVVVENQNGEGLVAEVRDGATIPNVAHSVPVPLEQAHAEAAALNAETNGEVDMSEFAP